MNSYKRAVGIILIASTIALSGPVPALAQSFDLSSITAQIASLSAAVQRLVALFGGARSAELALVGSFATPAFVQENSVSNGPGAASPISLPSPSQSGDTLIIAITYDNTSASVSSVTDNKGNTYQRAIGASTWGGSQAKSEMWYAKNITGGGSAITATVNFGTAPASFVGMYINEYSGLDASAPLDQTAFNTQAGNVTGAFTSGAKTTASANELIFGHCEMWSGSTAMGAGFANRSTANGNQEFDKTVSSIGSYSTSCTMDGDTPMVMMATFKAAAVSGGDTTAPSTPASLSATAVSSSQINLSWNASTDSVGVAGYKIYRGGVQIATVTSGTTYQNTGLTASTAYSYAVAAYDAAGNASAQSSSANATTPAASQSDTTAPSTPSSLSATAISSSAINLSWTASTDSVGVTGYKIYRGGTQVGTSPTASYSDTGLTPSTAYSYTVAAYDAAGNTSAQSTSASATTQAGSIGASGNIYIAQSAAGSANGTSCSNAYPVSFFNTAGNWGTGSTQIGPGDTVHLCGTLTTSIAVSGSGTAGNPITIFFEPNAKISMPVCPGRGTGCINTSGQTYITIDGGSNGIIESTANGTGLANHTGSYGIEASSCSNCEMKNLTIQNIYKRTLSSDLNIDGSEARCINFSGSNTLVHDNTCHDMGWALTNEFTSGNATNVRIYNNNIYNIDHGWAPTGATAGGNYGPVYFYNNHIHDYANWDSGTANAYHHDGIHCFSAQGTTGAHWNNVYIYDNRFDGSTGGNITADIFLEGGTGSGATPCADTTSHFNVFNNVFSATAALSNGFIGAFTGTLNLYNNTFLGAVSNNGLCIDVHNGGSNTIRNNISSGCDQLVSATPAELLSPSALDYNVYANCTGFNCWWVGNTDTANFSSYKSATGYDTHSISVISTTAGLDSSGRPQAGSPAIGAGTNLASLCVGDMSPLCNDIAGAPRGSTWDSGAYYVGGGSSQTSTTFTAGQRIQTTSNLNVRATASASGTLLGTQSLGALGTIVSGPTAAGGFNWWNVNYDSGVDGYSVEDYLQAYSGTVASGNIYIAQSAAGSGNGTSCANAYAVSFFNTAGNWGTGSTQIGPGDTVHLCGTISTLLTAQGSGSAGSVITIKFEDNAKLSQTGSSNIVYGILDITNKAYISVDGGTNGIIEATDNGDALANHNIIYGVNIAGSNNIEVKNLTIRNLYVHVRGTADTGPGWSRGITGASSNDISIHNNTIYDVTDGIWHNAVGQSSRWQIYGNTIYDCNWAIGLTSAASGSVLNDVKIYGNDIKISTNWDDPGNTFHHNGIFAYTEDSNILGLISNLDIYNNYFHGEAGGWISTAQVFLSGQVTPVRIYNNVFDQTTGGAIAISLWPIEHAATEQILNNTFLGHTTDTYAYSYYPAVGTDAIVVTGSTNSNITAKNNIIQTYSAGIVSGTGAATITSNNNDMYNVADFGVISGTYYANLAAWQAAGYDLNGINSNPSLDSNFKPQSGSLALNAGANLTSLGITALDSDKVGTSRPSSGAWSAGAYQTSGGGTSDITAPSVPSGLSATAISNSAINLSWTASTDSVGVTGYKIYRGGTQVGTSPTASYSDTGLTPSTAYSYTVAAYDAAGNTSAQSTSASATTQAGTVSSKFTIGQSVQTNATDNVRQTPAGTLLGQQAQGSVGTVTGGPAVAMLNGANVTWWTIDFASGVDGSVGEDGLDPYSAPSDITPPTLSAITSSGMTVSSAAISWTTDEAADTEVEYGLTTSYGQATTLNPALSTSHFVSLPSLQSSTLYHYRVKSKDAAGNLAVSGDQTFTTATPPDTATPVISAPSASNITTTGATIAWTTNEAADSQVEYGTTISYGELTAIDGTLATSHAMPVSSLAAGTLYHYRVLSRDTAGNLATGADQTFTTIASSGGSGGSGGGGGGGGSGGGSGGGTTHDTTPPAISSLSVTSRSISATVMWVTNESADSQVEYGTTNSYGKASAYNPARATSHSVSLSGLKKNITYHYRVKTKDAAGNLTVSTDHTFKTTNSNQLINVQAAKGSIKLSWQPAPGEKFDGITVVRSTTAYPASPTDGTVVAELGPTALSYHDTSVAAGIPYYYAIFTYSLASDGSRAYADPSIVSFIPQADSSSTITAVPGAAASLSRLARILTKGSHGSDVTVLQAFLIAHSFLAPGNSTGYFGSLTEAAVKAFQKKNGIVSSGTAASTGYGVVGARTRALINSEL